MIIDGRIYGMIENFIDGQNGDIEDFSGMTMNSDDGTNFSRRTNILWEALLNHLGKTFPTFDSNNFHYGIRESDFPKDKESLVEYINNNIDLDLEEGTGKNFLEKYLNSRLANGPHWNESIAQLAEYYYNVFLNENNSQGAGGTNININSLKNADAGYSFSNTPWVFPWTNIDEKNYEEIRDNDRIENVLKDSKNLQFTQNQQLNSYLKLIMPEYQRIVQIEDLDRNFWVIGQALTALCGFLFDDTSPLPELLSALLDEIIQLWENIFFLWVAASLLSKKEPYENIQTIFMPVANDILRPYIKYDDFENSNLISSQKELEDMTSNDLKTILQEIWDYHSKYLIDKYSNCAVVFFPEFRLNNYARNYYSKVAYIGCIVYDDSLEEPDDWLKIIPFNIPFTVDVKNQTISYEEIDNKIIKIEIVSAPEFLVNDVIPTGDDFVVNGITGGGDTVPIDSEEISIEVNEVEEGTTITVIYKDFSETTSPLPTYYALLARDSTPILTKNEEYIAIKEMS